MLGTVLYRGGRRYYLFDKFSNRATAYRVVNRYRKRYKRRGINLRYMVILKEGGLLYPSKSYYVYFDKVRSVFS